MLPIRQLSTKTHLKAKVRTTNTAPPWPYHGIFHSKDTTAHERGATGINIHEPVATD